ncbi:MAG: GNAT family N-acetyltransferase [Proteobacteria bacterium]|nr:GNAT family N-acetyltransferase [Pseudomonadota bacterium]
MSASDDFDSVMVTTLHEPPDPCGYLPSQKRRDMRIHIKPEVPIIDRMMLAEAFLESGFSYSAASMFYTPACEACHACKPIRYPINDFKMSDSQQEMWRQIPLRQIFSYHGFESEAHLQEHVDLAKAHWQKRFPKDEEKLPSEMRLLQPFYIEPVLPIRIVEVRDHEGLLIAGSLNLETENSLYGIIYYYDQSLMHLQPGKQMVLSLLQHCRDIGKDYLYVGAWNKDCNSLATKTQFRPYELHDGKGAWRRYDTPRPQITA